MDEITPEVRHITLKHVDVQDAEFIVRLRKNPQKNKYLSEFKGGVAEQRKWIEEYKSRELQGQERYFLIESNDGGGEIVSYGVVRMYDYQGDSFCWGSWILSGVSPTYVAIESVLCVYINGFYSMGFVKSHFDVRIENKKVNAFHLRMGARLVSHDAVNNYYSMGKEDFKLALLKYKKFLR